MAEPTPAATPAPAQPTPGSEVRNAIQVLVSVLGLASYVYLIGGIVSWVHFGAARLPSDVATAALPHGQLFEVGLRSIVFMALAFTVLTAVAYVAGSIRWGANGPDWHDLISLGGVDAARQRFSDPTKREGWKAHREQAIDAARARRAEVVSRAASRVRLSAVAQEADKVRTESQEALEAITPKAVARPEPEHAPLGDAVVKVVAGFNSLVLSAVIGLLAARLVELLFPDAWLAILLAWVAVFLVAHRLLTRWGPLRWPAWAHGVSWILVVVVALFVGTPLGLLLIAALAVATIGRPLARINPPRSVAELLRSPLPWALFTFYTLVGLSYSATPPVSFQRAIVLTTSGQRVGAFLSRDPSGLYMVTCTPLADATSTNERVVFINAADIKQVTVGGKMTLDSGQRPSLAAFAMQALGINAHPPTWFSGDLRARRAACVGGPPKGLTIGREDPALGAGTIVGPAPPGGQAHDGEPPIEQTNTPGAIAHLARLYQPTVEVTVADRFWPVSVGALLGDVDTDTGGRTDLCHVTTPITCAPIQSLSGLDPGTSKSSDYLRYPAPLSNDPANQFRIFEDGQSVTTGTLHHWLATPDVLDPWYTAQVYFYYAGPIDRSRWPARALDPSVASGLIGLEYWFFYPFNYYPTAVGSSLMQDAPLSGDVTNTDLHQGDWEHVTVLLYGKTLQPEWLYMARHADEGRFYPWTSPTLTFDHGHPIIAAAFGGHPSYDNHCSARPRARVDNLSSDWVVCGSGRFAFRATTTPLVDLAQTNWACWKGHFGEAKPGLEVNATGESDNVLSSAREFVFVAGPISPLWQAENGSLAHNTGPCAGTGPGAAENAAERAVARVLPRNGADHRGGTAPTRS
jgi:hypothetical protein